MDFFYKIHEEVHSLIFLHLYGKDILQCFEVSKSWNFFLGSSTEAMKKIEIKFEEASFRVSSAKELTTLLQSQRMYQNLSLNCWYLTNSNRKLKLMTNFPSLTELHLSMKPKLIERFLEHLDLPELKKLTLVFEKGTEMVARFIKAAKKLEALALNIDRPDQSFLEALVQCKSLKKLNILGDAQNFFSTNVLSKASFKLESLGIQTLNFNNVHKKYNLQEFMDLMSGTLTQIEVGILLFDKVTMISKLRHLKFLKLEYLDINSFITIIQNISTLKELHTETASMSGQRFQEAFLARRSKVDGFKLVIGNRSLFLTR